MNDEANQGPTRSEKISALERKMQQMKKKNSKYYKKYAEQLARLKG